jgi:hypothetical protein
MEKIIKSDYFQNFKVVSDPTIEFLVDQSLNENWWEVDGWSDMYGGSIEEFQDQLRRDAKGLIKYKESEIEPPNLSEDYDNLIPIFDFLEKKENKINPITSGEHLGAIKPLTIYQTKKGFGYKDKNQQLYSVPFPVSHRLMEDGEIESFVEEIKDNGVFVFKPTYGGDSGVA